jgi:hypothetical protein
MPRYESIYPNHSLFVDHYVIESRYSNAIRMLHAWDPPIALAKPPVRAPTPTHVVGTPATRRIVR